MTNSSVSLGANRNDTGQTSFLVWAPKATGVQLRLLSDGGRRVRLNRFENGYHGVVLPDVLPDARYLYVLDDELERPDPASRLQPEGVLGPSAVVDRAFDWGDDKWFGLPLRDYILYELHVGTFTSGGTFESIIPELPHLVDLGVNAIELMPIAQFPGSRNWGYDGVYPYAVQNTYGGPFGLKRLVNACHQHGLAVVLDVVYNHMGPEGNFLNDFGPYFTEAYRTGWGSGLNFDDPYSDEVRRFFIENALYWQREFHIDALRLDAVHAIRDFSAVPFLQQLARSTAKEAQKLNRRFHLIAESDLNNSRYILPEDLGGLGLDAQWSDDFHHSLHVMLTGERDGYYKDFRGLEMLARAMRDGWTYSGQYSHHRKRRHGNSPRGTKPHQLVVYAQNHDQIGNRMAGDRLAALLDLEQLKLAAGVVLLSPYVPMLFMGEEYGEKAPFQYFISHHGEELVEAVRNGRREEFSSFAWQGEVPDPQSEGTFARCVLDRSTALKEPESKALLDLHRELIRFRKESNAIRFAERDTYTARSLDAEKTLLLCYENEAEKVCAVFHFGREQAEVPFELPSGTWNVVIDSADTRWGGPGTQVPAKISSDGNIMVRLPPATFIVLNQNHDT